MSTAYQQIEQQEAAFLPAREKFFALERHVTSAPSMRMTHEQLESYVIEKTRDIAREVIQGHLDLRGAAEQAVRVVGAEGVERTESRSTTRKLRLLVGNVVVPRLLYQAVGVDGLAPQDAALSLPNDLSQLPVSMSPSGRLKTWLGLRLLTSIRSTQRKSGKRRGRDNC